jgi:hypothetical protein
MLTTEPEEGGMMSRVREEGKSDFVGSLGRVAIFVYQTLESPKLLLNSVPLSHPA